MPGTLWSAPVPQINNASLTVSSFTTATLTDISPAQVILLPGQLNQGTRVRITAHGSYAATTTASTLTFGFYMNQLGTAIGTTEAILGVSGAQTAVAVTGIPWIMQYWGRMTSLTAPLVGATNAQIVGRGTLTIGTSLTAVSVLPIPQTLAAVTVAQTATGLLTNTAQLVSVGVTIATNTGLTNVITDELTVELLG